MNPDRPQRQPLFVFGPPAPLTVGDERDIFGQIYRCIAVSEPPPVYLCTPCLYDVWEAVCAEPGCAISLVTYRRHDSRGQFKPDVRRCPAHRSPPRGAVNARPRPYTGYKPGLRREAIYYLQRIHNAYPRPLSSLDYVRAVTENYVKMPRVLACFLGADAADAEGQYIAVVKLLIFACDLNWCAVTGPIGYDATWRFRQRGEAWPPTD